jgi:hypothetical protein
LSAGSSFIKVRGPESEHASRLHCYVQDSVFGPPIAASGAPPVVLTSSAALDSAGGRIVWWEESSAYSDKIGRYLAVEGADAAAAQDLAGWKEVWGPDHVLRAISGQTAVLLAEAPPEPDKVEARHFALAPTCEAYRWGQGGTPVGAQVQDVGPAAASPTEETPAPPGSIRPRNQPGF